MDWKMVRNKVQEMSGMKVFRLWNGELTCNKPSGSSQSKSKVKKKSHRKKKIAQELIMECYFAMKSSYSPKSNASFNKIRNMPSATLKPQSNLKCLFPDFKSQTCMWKHLSGRDYDEYMSLLEKMSGSKEIFHAETNCLDNSSVAGESSLVASFYKETVCSLAWCPTPENEKITQYIALATNSTFSKCSYVCTKAAKGFLQLWNIGYINGHLLESKQSVAFTLCHNHGMLSDMVWCPTGVWEDPEVACSEGVMPRLGLLAIACSDGYIRIYSIPHPNFLTTDNSSFPLYCSYPCAILHPLVGYPSSVTQRSMCTAVSWQKTDYCRCIAGGYGNGMICVWLVTTTASLLTKQVIQKSITPYLFFQAYGSPVANVNLITSPGKQWVISANILKVLKVWDLMDTCIPLHVEKVLQNGEISAMAYLLT